MAVVNPVTGSIRGKIAGIVYAVRKGQNIMREYNPAPSNPSTAPQVESRAKLKALSQMSAVLAPAIAFRGIGAVTPRNVFLKQNYDKANFDTTTEKVTLPLTSLDLTGSRLGLPPIEVQRAATTVQLALADSALGIDAVVYTVLVEQSDFDVRLAALVRVDNPGTLANFETEPLYLAGNRTGVAFAYGIRFNTDAAKSKFGDIAASSGNVTLEVLRQLKESDFTLTETISVEVPAYQG